MNFFNTKIILFLLSLLLPNITSSQQSPGAKSIALAHSDIATSNTIFSLFNNPAGLSLVEQREFGVFYSPSPFGIKELSNGFAGYCEPTSLGNFSVGAMNYGFDLYTENEFVFGYSNSIIDNILIGFKFSHLITKIKRYGNSKSFNLSVGSILKFSNNISIGFSLENFLRNSKNLNRNILFSSGISYNPFKNSNLSISVNKEIDYPFSISAGCEYALIKFLHLRFGIQREPDQYCGGFGVYLLMFNLNYAASSHPELGITHQFDMIISL